MNKDGNVKKTNQDLDDLVSLSKLYLLDRFECTCGDLFRCGGVNVESDPYGLGSISLKLWYQ